MKTRVIYVALVSIFMLLALCFLSSKDSRWLKRGEPEASQSKELSTVPLPTNAKDSRATMVETAIASLVRPIEFYGKVVDQDGQPLAGVQVTGEVIRPLAPFRQQEEKHITTTNINGLFGFQGLRGMLLWIALSKQGYNVSSTRQRFDYSEVEAGKNVFRPDRRRPVVFTMWKSVGAEPMICHSIVYYHVPVDGMPVPFDLETGKTVQEGGDLEIIVKWEQQGGMRSEFYDWSATLRAVNGGLIVEGDSRMFLAPEKGYQQQLKYSFKAEDVNTAIPSTYYLQSRNGKNHARLEVFLNNRRLENRASVRIRSWLNPSGSRNLEYDPAKRIEVAK